MAKFLFQLQPTSYKDLCDSGMIFNVLFCILNKNVPNTVISYDHVTSCLQEISNYENLLVNIQLYNPFSLGIEITNCKVKNYVMVIFVDTKGISLGYANHPFDLIKPLIIEQDNYRKFISSKLKEINNLKGNI